MIERALVLILFATRAALGLEIVEYVTETFQGKTVDFEKTSTGKYPLKITAEGKTLEVLDPRFTPKVATDGKKFYELNESLTAVTSLEIKPDGALKTRREGDGESVEPAVSTRAQIAAFLIGKDRQTRAAFSPGVEPFLLESEKLVGQTVFQGGYDAGSSLLTNGKRFLVLGKKRYPSLVQREGSVHVRSDDVYIRQLNLPPSGELRVRNPGGTTGPVTDGTRWAYFNYAADEWPNFSEEGKKQLRPFFRSYLKSFKPGIGVRTQAIPFPPPPEGGYIDENKQPLSESQVKERVLNFVLNFIGTNKTAQPAKPVSPGHYDLSPFLAPEIQARIVARSPYRCGPEDKPELRLDWLVSTVLNDTFYRELAGIPDTIPQLERQLGIDLAFQPKSKERSNAAAPVSGVAHVGRVGSAQPQRKKGNLEFYGTYDFAIDEKNNLKQKRGDFRKHPHDFDYTGGEFIWEKENKYPVFALFKSDGGSLAAAPDSLVSDTETGLGPFIKNPASCLHCHNKMTRSPDEYTMSDPEDWMLSRKEFEGDPDTVERFGTYELYQAEIDKYYGKGEEFIARTEKTSENFYKALKQSKAFVALKSAPGTPATLLPKIHVQYNGNLTFRSAAAELGVSYEELKRVIPPSGRIDTFPELRVETVSVSDEHMTREQFEAIYCELKKRLNKQREEEGALPPTKDH